MKLFAIALFLLLNSVVVTLRAKVVNRVVGHLFKSIESVRRAEVWGVFSISIRCNLKSLKFCSSSFQITRMISSVPL